MPRLPFSPPTQSQNDIYWLPHIDRDTYGSFVYTSLLYLSSFGEDFEGGEFVFLDDEGKKKSIVQPRAGRVSFFTSGMAPVLRIAVFSCVQANPQTLVW